MEKFLLLFIELNGKICLQQNTTPRIIGILKEFTANILLVIAIDMNPVVTKVTLNRSQLTFTCSKLTIKTQEQGIDMFNVNNKDTRMMSLVSFLGLHC